MSEIKKIAFLGLFLLAITALEAQTVQKYFVDSTDNALDLSGFLNSPAGFMPVPIIITEPAVGMGGGLAAVFFHNKKNFINSGGKGRFPPVMTAGIAGYTSNETWFTMAAHQGSYLKDRIRYTGAIGYLSLNLSFYGAGIIVDEREYRFNMKGFVTFHELSFRIKKDLPLFAGFNYLYFNNDITFKTGINRPGLDELSKNTKTAGINTLVMWDSRDNPFTPKEGFFTAFDLGVYSKALGGQSDYSNFSNRSYFYIPIVTDKLYSGYRLYVHHKWGDVPFYELPFIQLRGIQALRYQDHFVGLGETEWRWQLLNRWSLVGFAGIGAVSESLKSFDMKDSKGTVGGGFRYLLASDYGIHAGIDIARGPEIWAWYITFGSNWFR